MAIIHCPHCKNMIKYRMELGVPTKCVHCTGDLTGVQGDTSMFWIVGGLIAFYVFGDWLETAGIWIKETLTWLWNLHWGWWAAIGVLIVVIAIADGEKETG